MDYKKVVIAILLLILIVSDIFVVFGKDMVGEYISVFAMISILSGIALIIMVIISRKRKVYTVTKVDKDYDVLSENKVEVKICSVCNTENKMSATFCKKCGTDLYEISCPICGTVNPHDQKYCIKCDTILQNEKRHL